MKPPQFRHNGRMTSPEPSSNSTDSPYASSTQESPTLPPLTPPKSPSGLAIAALVVGIMAFLLGLIPVFGAIVGLTAVVFGILAMRKNQSKGMSIAGIVLGGLAAVVSMNVAFGITSAVTNS